MQAGYIKDAEAPAYRSSALHNSEVYRSITDIVFDTAYTYPGSMYTHSS